MYFKQGFRFKLKKENCIEQKDVIINTSLFKWAHIKCTELLQCKAHDFYTNA